MINECTVQHLKLISREMWVIHQNEPVNNGGFVDDELLLAESRAAPAVNSKLYSKTMDELATSAHPTKSIQIVAGATEWVGKMRDNLSRDPCMMQGFNLKVAESEKYLSIFFGTGHEH